MSGNGARLEALTKELRAKWLQTKDSWADAKSQEFEHKFLEELFAGVDRATLVIEQLDKLLLKLKKDCE